MLLGILQGTRQLMSSVAAARLVGTRTMQITPCGHPHNADFETWYKKHAHRLCRSECSCTASASGGLQNLGAVIGALGGSLAHLSSFVYHHCFARSAAFASSFTTYCLLASIIRAYRCEISFSAESIRGLAVFCVCDSKLEILVRAAPSAPAIPTMRGSLFKLPGVLVLLVRPNQADFNCRSHATRRPDQLSE